LGVVVRSSNYTLYGDMSARVMTIPTDTTGIDRTAASKAIYPSTESA
jgi:hypothetical protein